MLKVVDYDIVFREVPGETTLALNLSLCPNRCPGCHSEHLQQDEGVELTEALLETILQQYGMAATCVAFMGGDNDPLEVARLASTLRGRWRTAWYSGRNHLPKGFPLQVLDYLKLGPYVAELGPLDAPTTNQRMYRVGPAGALEDITYLMKKDVARFSPR